VLLKRVVARAGDHVVIRDGRVRIDGRPEASYPLYIGDGGPDFGPAIVPAGRVLVLGDNRGNSHDGRQFGFVSVQALLGRAVAVYSSDGSLTWRAL
jgi:signal peptidase I